MNAPARFGDACGAGRDDAGAVEAARDRYWQNIVQTVEGDLADRLLLDKNPSIFPVLPGAVRLFPEARVLVALRDPRDIVWSCFTQPLPVNAGTAAFVRLESDGGTGGDRSSDSGCGCVRDLPRRGWRCATRAVARQPEAELQRVLSFLDLPWSAAVLAFHQRRDPVRSPTYAAADRPVHQEAVGRWRRYAALFEPLEAHLDEVIRELEGIT